MRGQFAIAFGVLALAAIGNDHLDFTGRFTALNSKISYIFYIVHFPAVVLCQYLLAKAGAGNIANFILTVVIAYPLTYALCLVIEKTRFIRVLFGSKIITQS